jgi:hypothetical protein
MRQHRVSRMLVIGLVSSLAAVMLFWAAWGRSATPGTILLLSSQEARQLRLTPGEWQSVAMPRALSFGPQIIIRRPQVVPAAIPTIQAKSPTDLNVIFQPRDAPVRMDSLKVEARKGFFSKSLTEMLRPYIRGDSIELNSVQIPAGRFMLDISIADASGNTTDAIYRLEVAHK